MSQPTFAIVPLGEIAPSPTNPRRHFPDEYISELASSIEARGIIQPLLVRSREDLPPPVGMRYELIAGECRLRAARAAGLSDVPVIIRDDLSENDVIELQLIENLQRRDLDVLEEADSYAALLELSDGDRKRHTVESLAEAISKSIHYIHQRLSLRRLPDAARAAMRSGELSFSVARLVAAIPSAPLREKALEEVLHPTYEEEPLTSRKAASHIRDHYMVDLKAAPFDREDPLLVPVELDAMGNRLKGGACTDCPWLSGNAKESPEADSAEGSPNLCMHPICHAEKLEASWEELRAAALKAGKKVLSESEAEKVLNPWGGLVWNSHYVELKDPVPAHELAESAGKPPSWKKLLASVEVKPEVVVLRDQGKSLEVVDKRQAVAAIKLQAKKNGSVCPLRMRGDDEKTMAQKETADAAKSVGKLDQVIRHEMALEAFSALSANLSKDGAEASVLWPLILDLALDGCSGPGLELAAKWLGCDHDGYDVEEELREELMKYPVGSAESLIPAVLVLLVATEVKMDCLHALTPFGGQFTKIAESFKVDLKAIEERVLEAHKEELKNAKELKKARKAPKAAKDSIHPEVSEVQA